MRIRIVILFIVILFIFSMLPAYAGLVSANRDNVRVGTSLYMADGTLYGEVLSVGGKVKVKVFVRDDDGNITTFNTDLDWGTIGQSFVQSSSADSSSSDSSSSGSSSSSNGSAGCCGCCGPAIILVFLLFASIIKFAITILFV